MVVEELIAKLGFKAEGLGELKKFENGLKSMRKTVSDVGTGLNKVLSEKASSIAGKSTAALSAGAAAAGKFAKSLLSTVASTAMMAAGIAAGTGAVLKMAVAFVRARGEAAKLRYEQQLAARGDKTRIGNIEKLQKGLDAISAGTLKDKAKEYVGGLAPKIDEAIRDGDTSKFKAAGVTVLDGAGRQRDTSAIAAEILGKFADMVAKGKLARREAAIEGARGNKKGEADAEGRANKAELEARKFAADWGIDGPMRAALEALRDGAQQFNDAMKKANRDNPGLTSDEEQRKADLAARWNDLANKLDGISNSISRQFDALGDAIALRILPALNSFADAIISWGKRLRLIPETQEEKDAKTAAKAKADMDTPEVAAAKKRAEKLPKGGDMGLFEWLFGFGTDLDKARQRVTDARREYETRKGEAKANADQNLPKGMQDSIAKALQEAAQKFIDAVSQLEKLTSKDRGAEQGAKDAGKKAETNYDQRKYSDIGNDQRTINTTINQTVNDFAAGARAAANAVIGAVTAKAANTSTAALTTP